MGQVALGRSREYTEADGRAASKLGKGKKAFYSTKGVGRSGPDPEEMLVMKDGLKVGLRLDTCYEASSSAAAWFRSLWVR